MFHQRLSKHVGHVKRVAALIAEVCLAFDVIDAVGFKPSATLKPPLTASDRKTRKLFLSDAAIEYLSRSDIFIRSKHCPLARVWNGERNLRILHVEPGHVQLARDLVLYLEWQHAIIFAGRDRDVYINVLEQLERQARVHGVNARRQLRLSSMGDLAMGPALQAEGLGRQEGGAAAAAAGGRDDDEEQAQQKRTWNSKAPEIQVTRAARPVIRMDGTAEDSNSDVDYSSIVVARITEQTRDNAVLLLNGLVGEGGPFAAYG